ncbi:MAG: peptidyl-prolyl cis-trans isomerase [Candidatus Omnitrophica bacterium]|nr:peptidyl-prolyl cis-trans isomerase [Candidatus Omnitrophota bacterium]
MNKAVIISVGFALLAVITTGAFAQAQQSAAPIQGTTISANQEAQKNDVLARVGDWSVTLDEFNKALEKLKPYLAQQQIEIDPDFKERMLNELIEQEILAQIAEKDGRDQDPEVIAALKRYRSAMLAVKAMEGLQANIAINSAEIKNFYDRNKDLFATPPKEVKILSIAFETEAQAQDIKAKLQKEGNFEKIARQYPDSAFGVKSAESGFIPVKDVILKNNDIEPNETGMADKSDTPNLPDKPKEFWDKLLALKKGETSDVFKASDGKFYIINLSDVKGGQNIAPFEQVSSYIEEYLKIKELNQAVQKLVEGFKAEKKVEVNRDLLK